MARGSKSDAQHPRTAAMTSLVPSILRKVRCWPAKEASGKSSAVAEERTATRSLSILA